MRSVILLAIAVVHGLVILWLLAQPPARQPALERSATVITIGPSPGDRARAKPAFPAEQSPAALPSPIPPPLLTLPGPVMAAAPEAASGARATAGGGCQLATNISAAVAADPVAMAELAALPRSLRTEADAVMLWNGSWIDQPLADTGSTSTTSQLRLAIERTVAAVLPQCRDIALTGPVLVPIVEGARMTMLVMGSGVWRWSDVLLTSATCEAGTPGACTVTMPIPSTTNYINAK